MRWRIQPGPIRSRSSFTRVRSLVKGQLPEKAIYMSLAGVTSSNGYDTYQSHHMHVCQLLDVLLSTLLPSVLLDCTIRRLFGCFGRGYLVSDCREGKKCMTMR